MKKDIDIVKSYYNENVEREWERLERHSFEFRITTAMMDRYIKPGEKILDIGGGPGRYSLYYAQKGCDVTLVDLSEENIKFAKHKANELGVHINAMACNAIEVDKFVSDKYDHVLVMGPMYHLLEESERIAAINAALSRLKEGGNIYVSFVVLLATVIYNMKYMPEQILSDNVDEIKCLRCVETDVSYAGNAFTKAFFISQNEIEKFMDKFNLTKLHIFGQESIMSISEAKFLEQPKEVVDRWIELAVKLCDRKDLLSHSEHLMYVGRK